MSVGKTGCISLEHINPDVLGGVSYLEMWYKAANKPSCYNYLSHKSDFDTYIKYSYGCDRVRIFNK